MTTDNADEATRLWFSKLRVLEPDPARAERVRARCRDTLAGRQQRAEDSTSPDGVTAVVLQPALVGGLCLIYLLGVVYDIIRLHSHP
jgi:hypothetical protein